MSTYTYNANGDVIETNYVGDIYPTHQTTKDEILLGNQYLKRADNEEIYPKKKNGDQFALPTKVYAQHKNGHFYYPQKANGEEFMLGTDYIKNDNIEIYPKLASGDEFLTQNRYAKNDQNVDYYPKGKIGTKEFYLILGESDQPNFIPPVPNVGYFHLHKTVKLNQVDYIYAYKEEKEMGDLFVDVMTSSSDKTIYNQWKAIKPSLPDQFQKHASMKRVFTRDQKEYFTFTDPHRFTEVLVDFDKKQKLHMYEKGSNNEKKYFKMIGNSKLYYKDMEKIVLTINNHKVLSCTVAPFTYFTRKDDETIEIYHLDTTGQKTSIKSLKVTEFVHRVDKTTQNLVGKELSKKEYFIYEKNELVRFDYIKQKSEMKRYFRDSDGKKQYFEWNGTQKTNIAIPTDPLDNFDENGNGSGWYNKMFVIYFVIVLILLAVYLFYPSSKSLPLQQQRNSYFFR